MEVGDLAFVDPDPPRLPWMSPAAHVLLTQRSEPDHASVLVSAVAQQTEGPILLQCMHYMTNRVSAADVVAVHLTQGCREPCRVRRRDLLFPAMQSAPIGNPRADDDEDTAMLQMPPLSQPLPSAPIILSLDAAIPPLPTGSARGADAAWSVVAVEYDWQGLPSFMGAISGLVDLNQSSSQWVEANKPDHVAAETTASVAAHLAALAPHTALTVIRPALSLNAMLSTSSWSCSTHSRLVAIARWLGQWFEQSGGSCVEARGHTAHPWNELADSLAKHALAAGVGVGCIDFGPCHQAVESGDLRWAWLKIQRPCLQQCFPPARVRTSWQIQLSLRRTTHPHHVAEHHDEQWHRVDLRLPQPMCLPCRKMVVGYLKSLPESASSRAERLDHQWHRHRIVVAGLQESRRPEGRYATTSYTIFAAGPLKTRGAPQGGCELWLHKSLPFLRAQDHAVSFTHLRLVVSCADHRRVVVHLHGQTISCFFVVLHAPCRSQKNTIEEIEAWWARATELVRDAELAPLTWIFIDANAPLASHDCV